MAAGDRAPLPDRERATGAQEAGTSSSPTSATGRRCARASRPSCARDGAGDLPACAARPNGARRSRPCTSASRAHRGRAGAPASAGSQKAQHAARPRPPRTPDRRLLERNSRAAGRYLIRSRRRPQPDTRRAAAGVVDRAPSGTTARATARAATCCAPTSPTGTPDVAVADLHPAHRGRGRLPHPQERAVHPARSGTRRPSASRPTSSSASWPTCCGRRSSSGSAGRLGNSPRTILDELAPHPQHRRRPAPGRRPGRELRIRCVVRPDQAQASCSIASACASPNASAYPPFTAQM